MVKVGILYFSYTSCVIFKLETTNQVTSNCTPYPSFFKGRLGGIFLSHSLCFIYQFIAGSFMTTRELILAEIDAFDDKTLEKLLHLIKTFAQTQPTQSPKTRHSILELRGLGKPFWQDVSVKDYVNAERDSWNG